MPTPSSSQEPNEQVMGSSQIATSGTSSTRQMDRTSSDNNDENISHTSSPDNHQNPSREMNNGPIPSDPNEIMFENDDIQLYVERGN